MWWGCSAHHYLELNITQWSAYCSSGLLPQSMGAATVSCGWVNKQWCQVEVGEPCSITSNRASNRKQAAGTSQPPRHELRSAAHHNNIIRKSAGRYLQSPVWTRLICLTYLSTMRVCVCVCVRACMHVSMYAYMWNKLNTISPAVPYGYQTWSLNLGAEYRTQMFKDKAMSKIFRTNWHEVNGEHDPTRIFTFSILYLTLSQCLPHEGSVM